MSTTTDSTATGVDGVAPTRLGPLAVNVHKATDEDLRDVTIALTKAFDDDPMLNWMAKQDDRRIHHIAWFMSFVVRREAFPAGELYTTDGVHGAACWLPPDRKAASMLQLLPSIPRFGKHVGWRRLPSVMKGFNAVEAKHPKEPHFYLETLGVVPAHQGRSIGTQLMAPVLERCDREGIGAYLESSKEINVPMYERNGFRVTEVFQVPGGGPPLWLMWRDPQ